MKKLKAFINLLLAAVYDILIIRIDPKESIQINVLQITSDIDDEGRIAGALVGLVWNKEFPNHLVINVLFVKIAIVFAKALNLKEKSKRRRVK